MWLTLYFRVLFHSILPAYFQHQHQREEYRSVKNTERVNSIRKDKVETIKMEVKYMILISPCCYKFENATARLKDAATR